MAFEGKSDCIIQNLTDETNPTTETLGEHAQIRQAQSVPVDNTVPTHAFVYNGPMRDYRSIQRVGGRLRHPIRRSRSCYSMTRCMFFASVLISGTLLLFVFAFLAIEIAREIKISMHSTDLPKYM